MSTNNEALAVAEKEMAELQAVEYETDTDGRRARAEKRLLDLLIEANQIAPATKLWEELVDRWACATVGGREWVALAIAQRTLGAKVPPSIRGVVRDGWGLGCFSDIYAVNRPYDPPAEAVPDEPVAAFAQAQRAIYHDMLEHASKCIAVAREDAAHREKCEMLEIVMLWAQSENEQARAAFAKYVERALGLETADWERIAALQVLVNSHDRKETKKIITAWKKADPNAASSIYEA